MLKIFAFVLIITATCITGCADLTTLFEEKKAEQEQVEDMGIWKEKPNG
tara:strand:- start:1660 stop:1806 length:147 start_codon:yes stop_codon:yes gene_type:complete